MNLKVLGILLFLAVYTKASCGHSHSHEHDHFHEEEPIAPSYKYSRQANEKFQKPSSQINSRGSHDHNHDHDHDHHHVPLPSPANTPSSTVDIWLHSLVSTLLISAAPFFILYFVPLDNTEKMHARLKTLLAFASGGLLGDAFLHLIPHSSHSDGDDDHAHSHSHHSHEESHSHHTHSHSHTEDSSGHGHSHSHTIDMRVGLWVLAGIIAFLAVEKIIRLMKLGHTHSHSHASPKPTKEKEVSQTKPKNEKVKNLTEKVKDTKEKLVKEKKDKDHTSLHVAGYLNLAADFTHNFTDGLAIGASYLAGSSVGMITTVAILLHEIPHEIGDFAILIKSGCSRKKAMFLQLITAVGAVAGNLLALLGSNIDASSSWILPFTAGGFIYIATVSVIPELLEDSTKLGQSLKEIFAMLLGVGMMVLIAYLE